MRSHLSTARGPFIAFLLAVLACIVHIDGAAADPRPNFVLITGDDLGVQLSSYDDHTIETPNIDGIAAAGVRFTNGYITQPSCSSSRSSMFTGSYPHQNGQLGLAHYGFSMDAAFPTIPTILHDAGYRTGVIGKVHVQPSSAFTWDFNPDYASWPGQTRDVRRVADEARTFIAASQGRPFFLKVSYVDPHEPLITQVLGLPESPIPASAITVNAWTKQPVPVSKKATIAAYYNSIMRLDIGVGLLLKVIADAGAADNTMIIFLGDNGGGMVQLGKTDVFENGLKVPFLIRFPSVGKAGQVRSELVSAVDILPTILAAAGVAAPPQTVAMMTEGRSLLPLIGGETVPWRQYLFAEMNYHNADLFKPSRTVRDERYKLIHSYPPLNRGINGLLLFDLQTDPLEKHNLAGDPAFGTIRDRLAAELSAWQARTHDTY